MTVHGLYDSFDPENPDLEIMTLCLDCAKHPSLKRFVEAHAMEGPICGICQEVGYAYRACDPKRKNDLTNLIKALIRFYYNEYEYNGHWGGNDEPEDLLAKPNPILEDQSAPGRTRSPDRSCDFLYDLFSAQPYPPVDEGISVYAGHDEDGHRNIQFALKDRISPILATLRARLATENYFDVEPALRDLVNEFADRITHTMPAGARYFRARIGIAARYADHSIGEWRSGVVRQPFSGAELSAPPPQLAAAGRLNRAGVAFLYLASDADTAAAEVRPHPGHFLSIGEFQSLVELKIATFDADIMQFAGNEHELDLFHFIYSTDRIMALPVVPGEASRYSITQLVAECLRQKGFDGVSFRSSVGHGQNLCVFRPELFEQVACSLAVREVKSLKYSLEASPTILKPGANHYPLKN
ncbi:RES family NAD+ phosphorylase [Pelagibius marinus]|uniref:RES family NAD+ phosphorylase n=1 Tax=Pelagibius marinus TaxID=2762760 RepID=UPI001872D58A|nr:RES family NAD+ phosphorylase [Pelagibius marinus]